MELTKQAVEVAKLFMDLNKKQRDKFHREITVEHMHHVEEASSSKVEAYGRLTRENAMKAKHSTS